MFIIISCSLYASSSLHAALMSYVPCKGVKVDQAADKYAVFDDIRACMMDMGLAHGLT